MLHKLPSLKSMMTPFPHPIDIERPLSEAQALFEQYRIRHLPVMENNRLVGVLSDRDIKWALDPLASDEQAAELLVRQVYRKDVYTVEMDEPLPTVLRELANRRIGSVIVLKNGKLVGMLTTTDVCRQFAEFLEMFAITPEDLIA